jgi:multimeric flavodoxin WrbA
MGMYKTKPARGCTMPAPGTPLRAVVLNGSLKHEPDVVLFATPVWWGGRSSLMQRAIERLDALDEEYIASGRSALYNKVAGIVITGSEDGALATMGSIMMVLTWMGFTLPPECAAYWVGEVGQPPSQDRARRLANEATAHMAKNLARNLTYYGQLLHRHPLTADA